MSTITIPGMNNVRKSSFFSFLSDALFSFLFFRELKHTWKKPQKNCFTNIYIRAATTKFKKIFIKPR